MALRKADVLIKHSAETDSVIVWTDATMVQLKEIEGVEIIYQLIGKHRYSVILDPRYDRESVLDDIRALRPD